MARTRRRGSQVDELYHAVAAALGGWSRECRRLLDVSQDAVAKATGVSQGAVSRVETTKCQEIPLKTYLALAWYYRKRGQAMQLDMPEPSVLLQAPAAVQVGGLDPARMAILKQLHDCTPRQQELAWQVLHALLDGLHAMHAPIPPPQPKQLSAWGPPEHQLPPEVSHALGGLGG